MNDTIQRDLQAVAANTDRYSLQRVINPLADRSSACMLGTAAIVISAGGAATAKTGASAVYALTTSSSGAKSSMVSIAAATVLTPNTGVTLISTFNVYVFYIDSAGTITSAMGTAATTLAGVIWPPTPVGKAIIGGFTVNPTAGSFTGNTTLLDAANTNVVYFSPVGAFDPTVLTGATVNS